MRDKEKKRQGDARYRMKVRIECFTAYGGLRCCEEGCTEARLEEFELHHPEGDGNKDRAEKMGRGLRSCGGWNFYLRLKKLGYPTGYAVMCRTHHDTKHGRIKRELRQDCSPGLDHTRFDDVTPF